MHTTIDMDFAPAMRWGAAGSVGVYVACRLREGHGLFEALSDEYVQERLDEHPDVLGELASDTLVRDAIVDRSRPVAVDGMPPVAAWQRAA